MNLSRLGVFYSLVLQKRVGENMEKINPGSLKAWLMLPRFQFLPLTVIMVSLGTAIAAYEGYFHLGHFFLAMMGPSLST